MSLVRLFRPLYWSKNLLLFLPLFFNQKWMSEISLNLGLLGFIMFSLAASTGYIFNDIMDRSNDRLSKRRHHRALANETVSVNLAFTLLTALIVLQIFFWTTTPTALNLVVWTYLGASGAYSLFFKSIRWIDVCFLSLFHLLRILFGFVLFNIPLNPWLMIFCFTAFLAMGILKRLDEVVGDPNHNRPYHTDEKNFLQRLVIIISVVLLAILASYVLPKFGSQYHDTPQILFLLIPLFALWIAKWLKAAKVGHICNPILYFFSQRTTYAFLFGIILILKGAK